MRDLRSSQWGLRMEVVRDLQAFARLLLHLHSNNIPKYSAPSAIYRELCTKISRRKADVQNDVKKWELLTGRQEAQDRDR